jgi:adenylate cyclase
VNDYDGIVEKNTGDGLMAYFADNGDATGAERAVACAMTLMASNTELTPHVSKTAAPIEFRVAIDFGPITVAQLGAPKLYGSIVAIGITANIANKMLRFAEANQIVIGEAVGLALPDAWQKHCYVLQKESGFVYEATQKIYPFYEYRGRWIDPVRPPLAIPPPPTFLSPPPTMLEILAGMKK